MPAHYLRCAYRSTQVGSGNLVVNVFHVEADTLTDPPNYGNMATDINSWLGFEYQSVLSSNFILQDLTITEETYPGATPGQGVKTIGTVGLRSAADTNLSVATCALLALRTATPKKYARGHLFLPPAMSSASSASGGQFLTTGPYMTAATTFATKLAAGSTAGSTSYAPIIFSRTRVREGLTPYFFKVTNAHVNTNQYFLRSRLTSP